MTSFFIKAMSMALRDVPKMNSRFGPAEADPPQYIQYGVHNISFAVNSACGDERMQSQTRGTVDIALQKRSRDGS